MPPRLAIDRPLHVKRPSSTWTVMLTSVATALLIATVSKLNGLAAAQPVPDQPSTPYVIGNCTNCHGTYGRSAGAVPSLAGLPASYIVQQMREFREGGRPSTVMHQIARGYTDRQTEVIADYFARQTKER